MQLVNAPYRQVSRGSRPGSHRSTGPIARSAILLVALGLASFQDEDGTPAEPAPEVEQGGDGREARPLTKVAPVRVDVERSDDPLDVLRGEFVPATWDARLTAPSIDARLRSYESLLVRARVDPVARAYVEARAKGSDEIAWTTRLALRELGAPSFLTVPLEAGLLDDQLESVYRRLADQAPELLFSAPAERRVSMAPYASVSPHAGGVRLRQNADGARIMLFAGIGGSAHVFDGTTLQEIVEQNPELRDVVRRIAIEDVEGAIELEFYLDLPDGSLLDPREYGKPNDGEGAAPLEEFLSPSGARVRIPTDVFGVKVLSVPQAVQEKVLTPRRGVNTGLFVCVVEDGSMADAMGVRPGDVLLMINGERLDDPDQLSAKMEARDRTEAIEVIFLDRRNIKRRGTFEPDVAPATEATREAPSSSTGGAPPSDQR